MSGLVEQAELLRRLHQGPEPLLLANAWDRGSARMVEEVGFAAVATSSHAVADVLGQEDGDTMPPDLAFRAVEQIAGAVSVPVTADIEAGYRLSAVDLVGRLLAAGAVGCNLEDTDHHGDGPLVDAAAQAERLRAVKEAARAAGVDIVLNARIDSYVRRVEPEHQREEMIRRGRLYLDAGADCVYPIGVADPELIRVLVQGIGGPVNIMLRPGAPSPAELRDLGVARISLGSGLFSVAMARARWAAARLLAGDGDLWEDR